MSVNYAAGLSEYAHKGKCGQPEYTDTETELNEKVDQLVRWIENSKHCVVLTGAGISTSTGIPDFRGPKGVWTLEEKGVEANFATTFDDAKASYAHMALVALESAGIVKHLITQNVDGLHIRSGFPRSAMSILHGDMFTEQCEKCSHQVIKDSCVKTMGLRHTGISCTQKSRRGYGCRGKMKDTILDWEDALPDDEIEQAIFQSKKADVFLVLGSSLQIVPAGNLPIYSKKSGGKVVSVNLQRTKHHKKTDLVIHSYIDSVMEQLCNRLGVVVSCFTKPSPVLYSQHWDGVDRLNISIDSVFLPPTAKDEEDEQKMEDLELNGILLKREPVISGVVSDRKRKSEVDIEWQELKKDVKDS